MEVNVGTVLLNRECMCSPGAGPGGAKAPPPPPTPLKNNLAHAETSWCTGDEETV